MGAHSEMVYRVRKDCRLGGRTKGLPFEAWSTRFMGSRVFGVLGVGALACVGAWGFGPTCSTPSLPPPAPRWGNHTHVHLRRLLGVIMLL